MAVVQLTAERTDSGQALVVACLSSRWGSKEQPEAVLHVCKVDVPEANPVQLHPGYIGSGLQVVSAALASPPSHA